MSGFGDGQGPPLPPVGDVGALAPPPSSPRRSRRLGLTALAGALVIGAVGFAASSLGSGDGASSPEEAVRAFFAAVDAEDAIGVAESLEPSERRIVRAALDEAAATSTPAEVAGDSLDLGSVDGLDLRVDGLAMTTEELADGVVAVDLQGGTVSTAADLDQLPVGPVVREALDRSAEDGEAVEDPDADVIELAGVRMVAVRGDDGWHLSVLHSLAEQVRLDLDPVPAPPDPANGIVPRGAATPEDAVREAIDAATSLDVTRLIELTPPDEARVLHTYGPILVDVAADEWTDEDGMGFEITDLELEVTDAPEGRKLVSARTLTSTFSDEQGTATTTYADGCTTSSFTYDEEWLAQERAEYGDEVFDIGDDESYEWCEDDPEMQGAYFLPFTFFASPGSMDVVVEEHDGEWFISPTRSLIESTLQPLRDLTPDDARRIARIWSDEWWLGEPAEFWEACGVEAPALDDPRSEGEAAYDACLESLPEDYAGSFGPYGAGPLLGSMDDGGYVDMGPEGQCYEAADAAGEAVDYEGTAWDDAFEACLGPLVEAGEVDPQVLVEHRCNSTWLPEPEGAEDFTDEDWEAFYASQEAAYEACVAGGGPVEEPAGG